MVVVVLVVGVRDSRDAKDKSLIEPATFTAVHFRSNPDRAVAGWGLVRM